jgi:hypothetical protein
VKAFAERSFFKSNFECEPQFLCKLSRLHFLSVVQFLNFSIPATMLANWIGQLGNTQVNQYRNVPYVESFNDGTSRCLLCDTGFMYRETRRSHFSGQRHAQRYNYLRQQEELVFRHSMFRINEKRIERLGSTKWKYDLKVIALNFLTAEHAMISDFEANLDKFERMEVSSLLELAIWKAFKCTDASTCLQDFTKGEDCKHKTEFVRFHNTGCEVIIPLVLEFLGKNYSLPTLSPDISVRPF